jgi:hypothetical protein
VTDSMWPPMVSYVWRLVGVVSWDPALMLFLQIYLLLFSIYLALVRLGSRLSLGGLFVALYLCIPVVLGTLAGIWKDVLMGGFLLAGFAVTLGLRNLPDGSRRRFGGALALLLLFLGVSTRHNAITAALPLLLLLAWIWCVRLTMAPWRRLLVVAVLGGGLSAGLFVTKSFLDRRALPTFVALPSVSDIFLQGVRALDIAGASICVGTNLYGAIAPQLSLADIARLYDPRHVNLSAPLLEKLDMKAGVGIDRQWLEVALQHPMCILTNKIALTKYLIGANQGGQFIITSPTVDQNEFGYTLAPSVTRDRTVSYIVRTSHWTIVRPWFIYLVASLAFVALLLARAMTAPLLALYMSALMYLAGIVMFGNAADARLLLYTTTTLAMLAYISIISIFNKLQLNPRFK